MSYTNQTTHYGIPLPTQTDLVNGLDWNTSSEAIDTAVYEASQAAQTASTDIAAIKDDIVDLQAADTQFAGDLLVANGRIATLEQNAGIDEESIQDAFDMITDTEVSQAQSDVHVNVNQWFRYNGVLYVCTQEINIGDTIIPNVNCRATNIEDEMPSSGGEVIDVTARGEIGTMSQLQTTDKSSLVAAINEVLSQIGGGGMPTLDYSNPLHTFSTANSSYTAVKDCYLVGSIYADPSGSADATIKVNNNLIGQTHIASGDRVSGGFVDIKLSAGDVVTITGILPCMSVYEEK